MANILLKLINMSIAASWLVLAVLLVRLIFKKAPKFIMCALWAFVGIRLICPFSIESVLSLIPSTNTITNDGVTALPVVNAGVEMIDEGVNQYIRNNAVETKHAFGNIMAVLPAIWLIGIAVMLIYMLVSYLRIHHKVREAMPAGDDIWVCDHIGTPFILGVVRPRIYLPSAMRERDVEFVIAHERAHLQRFDHVWKLLGFVILTLHWFNPLMWAAYVLFGRDIELACDEKVIKQLGIDIKKPYSEALINCSVPRKMISACPLAFGEVGVKDRIKSVLSYKKPAFWVIVVASVALAVLAVCFLTDPVGTEVDIDDYISSVILEQNRNRESDDHFCCEEHTILGTRRIGGRIKVYAVVYYTEYSFIDGTLASECGSHIPTVITLDVKNGEYSFVDYEIPRDGSYNQGDIKKMFPWYLWRLTSTQLYVEQHKEGCLDQARAHFELFGTTLVTNSDDKTFRQYVYLESPDPMTPTVTLREQDNSFSFSYSVFSSYLAHGNYEISDGELILRTYDGDNVYFFEQTDNGWRFVANKSSKIPSYRYSGNSPVAQCPVPDRAEFVSFVVEQGAE